MMSVVACEPELPPLEIMSGTNKASTTALAISSSKNPIAVAVNISLRNKITSQGARLRTSCGIEMSRYGASRASEPPMRWNSTVASFSATSSTSSMVTMPTIAPPESTTGSTVRSYLRNTATASRSLSVTLRETKLLSRMSLTLVVSGRSRNSRMRMSSIKCPSSSTM